MISGKKPSGKVTGTTTPFVVTGVFVQGGCSWVIKNIYLNIRRRVVVLRGSACVFCNPRDGVESFCFSGGPLPNSHHVFTIECLPIISEHPDDCPLDVINMTEERAREKQEIFHP